ncbi:MAG: hypothetical protein ACFN38_02610 [Campylobacter sp.]
MTKFGLYRVKFKSRRHLASWQTAINLKPNLRGDFKKICVKITERVVLEANL